MAKSAIVTGASGGIGRAVAKRLADDGFAVVVNYAGNAARADDVVAEITAAGGRALAVQADVASAPDVARLFKQAGDAFGKSEAHSSYSPRRPSTCLQADASSPSRRA